MSYSRVRDRLSEYGVNYIVNNIKTSEAWLQFAKYYPPKYVRKRLLKLGYEIDSRDYWENFVFRIKNNLVYIIDIVYLCHMVKANLIISIIIDQESIKVIWLFALIAGNS